MGTLHPVDESIATAAHTRWDIGREIDARAWSGRQKLLLLLVGGAIMFDGFDNQSLGLAAPAIIRDWGISKEMLAPILALSQVGMMIGTAFGGMIGDRVGRKAALVLSVLLFGAATLTMAVAPGIAVLGVLRVTAGVGLGGALPNAAALVAEYTPLRRRSLAVTASIVCVPLGGVVGGLIAARVLPAAGWHALFALAGILPLLLAALLLAVVPESARFLLARGGDTPRARHALARAGFLVEEGLLLVDAGAGERTTRTSPFRALLSPALRRDSAALWAAFGFCLLAIYLGFGWLPTMLVEAGFTLAQSSTGLMAFNLGGVVAALGGALLIGRLGSRRPMVALAAAGALGGALLLVVPLDPRASTLALVIALGLLGGCVNGVQTTLYALAAHVYPVTVRATGVGAASGVGRIGAIASSFVGAAVLGRFGAAGFFATVTVAMLVTALGLLAVRAHVPATGLAGEPR